jgi:hypothetical protein
MAYRVNVMLEDAAWGALQNVPKGERSRVVNTAILDWLRSRRRAQAIKRLGQTRKQLPPISTEQIVDMLRADRGRLG